MDYLLTRQQARETLNKLGFQNSKLPAIQRSLILNFPGKAWRIDWKGKDAFLMYEMA